LLAEAARTEARLGRRLLACESPSLTSKLVGVENVTELENRKLFFGRCLLAAHLTSLLHSTSPR
jgi:hypothetical protein